MCGRFTQAYTWREVYEFLQLTGTALNLQPRYNVAPTTTIDAVTAEADGRTLSRMRWGLVPRWWKKTLKEVPATFNARAESVATKPMFRDAFKRRRCLIPMSGFYEWKATPAGKQPYYISSKSSTIIAAAGLWDEWTTPEGEQLRSCTMIVRSANAFMAPLHDRMPVFLDHPAWPGWLSGASGTEAFDQAPDGTLQMRAVSKRVNKVGNDDDATLINRIANGGADQ